MMIATESPRRIYPNFIDFYIEWPVNGRYITLYVDMDYLVNRHEDYFKSTAIALSVLDRDLIDEDVFLIYREIYSPLFRGIIESIAKYRAEEKTRYTLSAKI